MNTTKRNFWLDVTIFIALLVTTITGFLLWLVIRHRSDMVFLGFSSRVWVAAHISFGVLGLAGIVMHIVRHWGWLKALRGRPLSGMPEKLRLNRVVNRVMWFTYIATNVFGAVTWALHFGNDASIVSVPERLHVVVGVAWAILAIVHLVLHRKWIISTTRRYIVLGLGQSRPIQ